MSSVRNPGWRLAAPEAHRARSRSRCDSHAAASADSEHLAVNGEPSASDQSAAMLRNKIQSYEAKFWDAMAADADA